MRRVRELLAVCITLCCLAAWAEQRPVIVSVADLALNPRILDGHLVRVRGWLAVGWEGDKFLYDPASATHKIVSYRDPALWFYFKPGYERQVGDAIKPFMGHVEGTLTGYFHFVPDKKSRKKDLFDPGPLQLEVIAVYDVGKEVH
jgi:hypothetical protein